MLKNRSSLKLTISVIFNIAFILFFIGKRVYYTYGFAKPVKENIDWIAVAEQKNKDMVAQFASFPIHSNDVVFVGNSLTEAFPVEEYFAAKNRGIGGNTIQHVINWINQVTAGQPRKIFIEIGINDINAGALLDTIKLKYFTLIQSIKTQSPGTLIYIQSLTPTCKDYTKVNSQIPVLNSYLEHLSVVMGATYINIYPSFLKHGVLNDDLTSDGLHLNLKGYEIWRQQIEKYVTEATPKPL